MTANEKEILEYLDNMKNFVQAHVIETGMYTIDEYRILEEVDDKIKEIIGVEQLD